VEDTLVLETMYYADEVRQPEEAPTPEVRKAEVDMAKTLIENLAATWDPSKYHDNYRTELLDLLQKKAEGEPLPEPQGEEGGEVVDLMDALRASVQATKKRRAAAKTGSSASASRSKRGGSSSKSKSKTKAKKAPSSKRAVRKAS